jgi:hypothetical protein
MVVFLVYFCVCLSVLICLSIVLFLMHHRLLYNYFLKRSSECPLISFVNDHSNITYLASAFILDYEVVVTHISCIDLLVHL